MKLISTRLFSVSSLMDLLALVNDEVTGFFINGEIKVSVYFLILKCVIDIFRCSIIQSFVCGPLKIFFFFLFLYQQIILLIILLSPIRISLLLLYLWTSVPVSIKGAAGCREFTIFHSKREGSHLIKKGRGKTLAGQWERSRIDQPVSLPHRIIFVWQHHPKVEVRPDFSWTERLTSNTRLKWGCRILAGPNENINC